MKVLDTFNTNFALGKLQLPTPNVFSPRRAAICYCNTFHTSQKRMSFQISDR